VSVEVKVGILFLLIAALAVAAGLFLTQTGSLMGSYPIVVHFKDTKGLQPGADVLLAGVNIGRVVGVELAPDPRFPDQPVAVTLALRKSVSLFETDRFVIDQGSLLGDKFVGVQRPSPRELEASGVAQGQRIAAGADLSGGPMLGFANLSEQVASLIADARAAVAVVTATYASPEIRQGITEFLRNVNQASGQLQAIGHNTLSLVATLNRVVQANQGAVSRTMANIESASGEIKAATQEVTAALRTIAGGPLPANLLITVANIRKTSEEVRASAEALRGLLCDQQNRERVEGTLADIRKTAADLAVIAESFKKLAADQKLQDEVRTAVENLRVTTDNLRQMSEASKQILTSRENLEAINATIANLRALSTQGVAVTQKASGALDRVDRTMSQLGRVASSFTPDETVGAARLEVGRRQALQGDVNLDLRWGDDPYAFWRVGVRGVGRHETLNLQRSLGLGRNAWARAGIFGGKPGVALDYRFSRPGVVELEAWHANENRLDLRAYWQLNDDYLLTAGLTRFLRENDPFIGLERVIYRSPGSSPSAPPP
jgi:ABC-type transporter Mla subunit MlaD